ncbi:MAG TPA: PTS sugar transporter subunit IIA [Salinisphaeraceae bacterium]|nr:PTS sugar transporter subunit IIA [Salinisphaeraceae bacterium]
MKIADIIAVRRVSIAGNVQSKKRALEHVAGLLAEGTPYLTAAEVFSGLMAREKIGSTGIGAGIAIPHARMQGADECIGACVHFPRAVEFEAEDGLPVDLVFGLLVPERATAASTALLHDLTIMLGDPVRAAALRAAANEQALFRALLDAAE